MKTPIALVSALTGLSLLSGVAQAAPISWTDWTTASVGEVGGILVADGETVGVTYNGSFSFASRSPSISHWNHPVYTAHADIDNGPDNSDIVALNLAGTKTISFTKAILNPILAMVSWNIQSVDFGTPIEILSSGPGTFGSGTPILNSGGTGFSSVGEFHGVIRLSGSFTEITFTDTVNENWHGFTVGVEGLATAVPAPGALLLLGFGLLGLGMRRRTI